MASALYPILLLREADSPRMECLLGSPRDREEGFVLLSLEATTPAMTTMSQRVPTNPTPTSKKTARRKSLRIG